MRAPVLFAFLVALPLHFTPVFAEGNEGANLTNPTTDFSKPEAHEHLSAGASTSLKSINKNSFSHSSANMKASREFDFKIGNAIFRKAWASSPASTRSSDGLGPLYNARACQRCHLRDGRGHPPKANWPDDNAISMLMRLSIPPETEKHKELLASRRIPVVPEPHYGGQLQDLAVTGHDAEGKIHIEYTEQPVTLGDGKTVNLRKPTYSIDNLGYGPLHPKTMMSVRVAPPMIGLGALEAIRAEDILKGVDPDDKNGDGISGRANKVWSQEENMVVLGRFGWKAGQPTVSQQDAGAFAGDIGISSLLNPAPAGDCTQHQQKCLNAPHGLTHGAKAEVSKTLGDLVDFYSRNLAVPARRDVGAPQVLRGKELFYNSGCIACHTPKFQTSKDALNVEQRDLLIWPYSDMLLHDLGAGLADNRPEGVANGQEWRTPPLWGIGLTKTVNKHTFFLHDGRARSLLEAILWHGGEAQNSRDIVVEMDTADRQSLIKFLESL